MFRNLERKKELTSRRANTTKCENRDERNTTENTPRNQRARRLTVWIEQVYVERLIETMRNAKEVKEEKEDTDEESEEMGKGRKARTSAREPHRRR